jgi:hypothetical protein
MNSYGYLFNLAGYPALFSIRPDFWQVKSGTGIWPDNGYRKGWIIRTAGYPVHP